MPTVQARPRLVARPRRLRARVLDHDDGGLPAAAPRATSPDSTTLIALVLAAEGVFAITLPLVVGPWSDTFHTPLGRRRPFMLAALGPIGFCLALMAFMPNIWTTALLVFAFFFAYYVYEPPYRGLYPDVLPRACSARRRASSTCCAGWRSAARSSAAASSSTPGARRRSSSRPSRRRSPAGLRSCSSRSRRRGGARLPRGPQLPAAQRGASCARSPM